MSTTLSIASLQERSAAFVRDREYEKYHSPKNVVMSLSTEVGELAEHFITPSLPLSDEGVEEVADVFSNVLELAMRLNVDLPDMTVTAETGTTSPESLMMSLVHKVSLVSEHFIWLSEEESKSVPKEKVASAVEGAFHAITQLAQALKIDLLQAASDKLDKNERKYSLAHAKGRRVKGVEV